MPNENEAAPLVVMIEVVLPRIAHVVVLLAARQSGARVTGGHKAPQTCERDLAIHRCIGTTFRREARELLANDVEFGGIGDHVAVRRRIGGYGRIHVEAIDRRIRIRAPHLARQLAAGIDNGGSEIRVASVVSAGPAQPRFGIGIIIGWRLPISRGSQTQRNHEGNAKRRNSHRPIFPRRERKRRETICGRRDM